MAGLERHAFSWTVEEVASYLGENGFSENTLGLIKAAEVNGPLFLALDDEAMEGLGLDQQGKNKMRRLIAQFLDFGKCSQHDEAYKYHCVEDNKLICTECFPQHRLHEVIKPSAEVNKRKESVPPAVETLNIKMREAQEALRRLGPQVDEVHQAAEDAKARVDKQMDSLIEWIGAARAKAHREIDEASAAKRLMIETNMIAQTVFLRECHEMQARIKDIIESPPVVVYQEASKLVDDVRILAAREPPRLPPVGLPGVAIRRDDVEKIKELVFGLAQVQDCKSSIFEQAKKI